MPKGTKRRIGSKSEKPGFIEWATRKASSITDTKYKRPSKKAKKK